jgi:alanyl-tRNA synthetase
MTDRLYYIDPYLREFDAVVTHVQPRDTGWIVALDRSAFYPTSGGQPFDVGMLGGRRVVDVFDDDNGTVRHVVERGDGPPPSVGAPVRGIVDWARRFDHMQQHTGQHVLSAAFEHLFKVRTVSFHLSATGSTIDLAREVTPGEIAAAEDDANRIVWEDRPVAIRFATAAEAAAMPLRKEPARSGTLRLIEVQAYDLSACGGTHVARTGAIGVIAIGSWERFKGGSRIEFLCGGRALRRFRALRDAAGAASRVLSTGVEELAPSIERLQGDLKEQKRALTLLQAELARYRAEELAASAEEVAGVRLVARAFEADGNGLKGLASAVAARPGHAAVLVSASRPALVVVVCAGDVALKSNEIVAALLAKFGGRGGGKPDAAQAGGLDGDADAILAEARAIVARTLSS